MHGADEQKLITQLAALHPGWKVSHSAVLGILLAHRNLSTHRCNPSRETIAAGAALSVRTVNTVLADLRAWKVIEWKSGGKRGNGQRFCNQYVLPLFTLVSSGQNSSGQSPVGKNIASQQAISSGQSPVGNGLPTKPFEALEAQQIEAMKQEQNFEFQWSTISSYLLAQHAEWEWWLSGTYLVEVRAGCFWLMNPNKTALRDGLRLYRDEIKKTYTKTIAQGTKRPCTCAAVMRDHTTHDHDWSMEFDVYVPSEQELQFIEAARRRPSTGEKVCSKHPESGRTIWGTCWSCYAEKVSGEA